MRPTHYEAFKAVLQAKTTAKLDSHDDLYQYSISDFQFWTHVMQYANIQSNQAYQPIFPSDTKLDDNGVPIMDAFPTWYPNMTINMAQNILVQSDMDKVACHGYRESGHVETLTYQQLYNKTSICIQLLKSLGVQPGDVVCAVAPNAPITIVWFLATNALGAVFSTCSCDFGVTAIQQRFQPLKPKVLFCVDAVLYNNKVYNQESKINDLQLDCSIYCHAFLQETTSLPSYEDAIQAFAVEPIAFYPSPFHSPVYILFSSGTTGAPKCIVHGNGAFVQHVKEQYILQNCDQDTVLQYTTTGWMMWQYMVSYLYRNTIVCYDGSPLIQTDVLWRIVKETKATVLGISPKYIAMLQEKQYNAFVPLRLITSTGAPLPVSAYGYIRQITNGYIGTMSGGTDIVSCFMGPTVDITVKDGEMMPYLGMHVTCRTPEITVESPGELACERCFPSMPLYFLNDKENEMYRKAYFDQIPHVWVHGDYMRMSKWGSVLMMGRSDGTLKPGGVRFGSSDLYHVLENIVEDCIAVGQQVNNDERVLLFVKQAEPLSADLVKQIKTKIRQELSPRHVPSVIEACPDIPYTMNGKKVEMAVKHIVNGRTPNTATLSNPECLDFYRDWYQRSGQS